MIKTIIAGNAELVDQVMDQVANKPDEISTESTDWSSYKKHLATPAVRRLAQENNIKLSDVVGTGKDGRVLKEDVLNYMENKIHEKLVDTHNFGPNAAELEKDPIRRIPKAVHVMEKTIDTTEKLTAYQKGMFKSMTQALQIPQFGLGDEIDVSNLVKLKPIIKSISEKHGVSISYMPFMIKAASLSLKQFPILNSSLTDTKDALTYKSSHNIGVAMDTPHGLLVPNIKNVESLSIIEIAKELKRLQFSGSIGQLTSADLSGGTFTLSNIGSVSFISQKKLF